MTDHVVEAVRELLGRVEASRGRRAVMYHSSVEEDTVAPLYMCLRQCGDTDALDLVLSTHGGSVTATRQIAMLLRDFTDYLTILVPHRARSAGTLLCLGADQLVLGPLAELGPVDAMMAPGASAASGVPGVISAEDVRAFRSMARDWFDVDRAEDRLQLLALLATRVFPTSLSSFYRFDRLVRDVAEELLQYQLRGDEHLADRSRIVNKLVGGYHSHDVVISRRDAQVLGLRAVDAAPDLEEIFWSLYRALPGQPNLARPQSCEQTIGIIAATDFSARHVLRPSCPGPEDVPVSPAPGGADVDFAWEIGN
jgi:hypothetical protein